MNRVARVAVSIPKTTLQRLDRLTRRSKRSRSALVSEAVELLLRVQDELIRDEKYVEAYRKKPDLTPGEEALAASVIASWEEWR